MLVVRLADYVLAVSLPGVLPLGLPAPLSLMLQRVSEYLIWTYQHAKKNNLRARALHACFYVTNLWPAFLQQCSLLEGSQREVEEGACPASG
jgi:hypothetical protein